MLLCVRSKEVVRLLLPHLTLQHITHHVLSPLPHLLMHALHTSTILTFILLGCSNYVVSSIDEEWKEARESAERSTMKGDILVTDVAKQSFL